MIIISEEKTEREAGEEKRKETKIATYVPMERTPAVAWLRYSCEPAYVCDMTDEDGSPTKFADEMMIVAIRTNAGLREELKRLYGRDDWFHMAPDEALSIIDGTFHLVRLKTGSPGNDIFVFLIDPHTKLGKKSPVMTAPCAGRADRSITPIGLTFVPDENAPLPREDLLSEAEKAAGDGEALVSSKGVVARGWLKFDPIEVERLCLNSTAGRKGILRWKA